MINAPLHYKFKYAVLVMENKREFLKKMEDKLEELDIEIKRISIAIDKKYLNTDIPHPIKKKMNKLVDLRKDLADKIHEMRLTVENTWEEIEKNAVSTLDGLIDLVESFKNR